MGPARKAAFGGRASAIFACGSNAANSWLVAILARVAVTAGSVAIGVTVLTYASVLSTVRCAQVTVTVIGIRSAASPARIPTDMRRAAPPSASAAGVVQPCGRGVPFGTDLGQFSFEIVRAFLRGHRFRIIRARTSHARNAAPARRSTHHPRQG